MLLSLLSEIRCHIHHQLCYNAENMSYINIIQNYTVSFSSVSVVLNTTVCFVNMDDIMCLTLLLKSYRSFFPQEFSLSCSPPSCLSNLVHHFGFICVPWALLKPLIPWVFASSIRIEDHLFKKLACWLEFLKNVKWRLRGLGERIAWPASGEDTCC